MSILIMNTDFSKLRNSVIAKRIVESMTFKPNAWWTEKSQDMDLFRERTGIALEPTVQESPGTSCDRGLRAASDLGLSSQRRPAQPQSFRYVKPVNGRFSSVNGLYTNHQYPQRIRRYNDHNEKEEAR